MEFLIDTNTISYIIDNRSDRAQARLVRMDPTDRAYCSTITEGELLFGAANAAPAKQERLLAEITSFLSDLAGVVPIDRAAAQAYGRIKYDLKQRGALLADNDLWIAATAAANGFVLVSHDDGFQRIPDLKLEDWLA